MYLIFLWEGCLSNHNTDFVSKYSKELTIIDPPTVFFNMAEKNALKSVNFAEFESDLLKTDENIAQQSR